MNLGLTRVDLMTDSDVSTAFAEVCSKVNEEKFLELYNNTPKHITPENKFSHVINSLSTSVIKGAEGTKFKSLEEKLEQRFASCIKVN